MEHAPSTIQKTKTLIINALHSNKLTPGDASKLRGVLGWLEGTFVGKPLGGAMSSLIARQFWDHQHFTTPQLQQSLQVLGLAVAVAPPRVVHILPHVISPSLCTQTTLGLHVQVVVVLVCGLKIGRWSNMLLRMYPKSRCVCGCHAKLTSFCWSSLRYLC